MEQQKQLKSKNLYVASVCVALALAVAVQSVSAVITVQIGGATRLNSLSRQRERYNCYWDCDLVGCQIARDDDECAYDCEKICRVRYDYAASAAAGRSGAPSPVEPMKASASETLSAKSAASIPSVVNAEGSATENDIVSPELMGAGTSVRLHLPRNATARNFAIWERCQSDAETGKLTEKPFNL